MGQVFTAKRLSGAGDSSVITISGTGSGSANTIHASTSSTDANVFDEIELFAFNTSDADQTLFISTADTSLTLEIVIPAKGTASTDGIRLVLPKFRTQDAVTISAYASTTNVIGVFGNVTEIR